MRRRQDLRRFQCHSVHYLVHDTDAEGLSQTGCAARHVRSGVLPGDCADAIDHLTHISQAGGETSECVLALRSKGARSIARAAADTDAACASIVAPSEGGETDATATTLLSAATIYCIWIGVLAAKIIASTFGL